MQFFQKGLWLVVSLTASVPAWAQIQNLMIPVEVQKTYDLGTRTTNGKPGPNYWQNHSNYQIQAELDPRRGC